MDIFVFEVWSVVMFTSYVGRYSCTKYLKRVETVAMIDFCFVNLAHSFHIKINKSLQITIIINYQYQSFSINKQNLPTFQSYNDYFKQISL